LISGSISPSNSSTISNFVPPRPSSVSVNVRVPWNMGAKPSCQTIRWRGTSSVTLGLKVRPGAIGTRMASRWPSAIGPSRLSTVEFQRGKSAASVSLAHTAAGGAAIRASTW
jgi:hypothetical protein